MGASYGTISPLRKTQANVVTACHHVMQEVVGYNAEAVKHTQMEASVTNRTHQVRVPV